MHLRLHTRYQNSAGERVRIVLNLKGIAYDYVVAPPVTSDDYRRINPQGLLPALEVDGQFVAQSMAIIELIEELAPTPAMLPADPMERARVRAFAHHISADLHPINSRRIRTYLATEMGQSDEAVTRWYRHWVGLTFASLEAELSRRPVDHSFCFGDTSGLADACLAPQLANARRFDCDLSGYPQLTAIGERCAALAAFRDAAPASQPDYRPD
jgi:maleylacetoacetate isomerase